MFRRFWIRAFRDPGRIVVQRRWVLYVHNWMLNVVRIDGFSVHRARLADDQQRRRRMVACSRTHLRLSCKESARQILKAWQNMTRLRRCLAIR